MRQIIARYPGRCFATGQQINPGDPIYYDPKGRRTYARTRPEDPPGAALALDIDPTLDRDTAEAVGRYMAASRYQSDIYRVNGREYYRNKAGLCIDAPCCGCCNA